MYSETIKTLDLSAFIEKTLEIKMVDGTILHLKRPTKAIVMSLQAIQEAEATDRISLIDDFIAAALAHNTEGVGIDKQVVTDMPELMKTAIMGAYFDFIHELVDNPNSQSPACQKGEENKKARKSRQK